MYFVFLFIYTKEVLILTLASFIWIGIPMVGFLIMMFILDKKFDGNGLGIVGYYTTKGLRKIFKRKKYR